MKKFRITLTVEERYFVEAEDEEQALNKINELEPSSEDIVDTEVEVES